MSKEILITKKTTPRGEDGYKIISVRMRDDLVNSLDSLVRNTNRSRNELINILLREALDIVKIDE